MAECVSVYVCDSSRENEGVCKKWKSERESILLTPAVFQLI